MENLKLFIVQLLSCVTTVYIIFNFMNKMYTPKYTSKRCLVMGIACSFLATFINCFQIPFLNMIFFICITISIGDVFFVSDNKWKYIYNVSFIVILGIIEEITIIALDLIFSEINSSINFKNNHLLYISISAIIILLIYRIVINLFINKDINWLSSKMGYLYIVLPTFSILNIYTIMQLLMNQKVDMINILGFLCILFTVLLNIFFVELLDIMSQSNLTKCKLDILENQIKIQYNYYKNLEVKFTDSRKMLHDVKKHLTVIESLYKKNDYITAEKYENNLTELIDNNAAKIFTKNKILNIILNDKFRAATENEISLKVKIMDCNISFITDIDITVIFGNLLDNAFEECLKLSPDMQPEILIQMKEFNENIIINICNTKTPIKDNKESKKRIKGNHQGLGLINVNEIVKKYSGYMSIYNETNQFVVNIVLPKVN